MKIWLYAVLVFAIEVNTGSLQAQESPRYWIYFTDKGGTEQLSKARRQEIVEGRLSDRALKRRMQRVSSGYPESALQEDLPLEARYIKQLQSAGFRLHGKSRWLNAVSGSAAPEVLQRIGQLPFVREVAPVKSYFYKKDLQPAAPPAAFSRHFADDTLLLDYGNSAFQITFHNIHKLHQKGLTGQGVVVAMFDTGFRLDHPALEHIHGQLLAEYDFIQGDHNTANQPGDHPSQDRHGTITLSALGGYMEGNLIGPAYRATFLLAKTEKVDEEIHTEEDNWQMAAEWADSLGADIVSSSLGYSEFDAGQGDYTYEDMNGQTTIVTRAAENLAQRGVLVVNSAGNEGGTSWRYITAPADGFHVLAVGALTSTGNLASFSSVGPTADGRIKPDVCALGVQVYAGYPGGSFGYVSGTSLSCPLVAGISALLLQQEPTLQMHELTSILKRSADNSAAPDNYRGWGKVDAQAAWYQINPEQFIGMQPNPNPYITGTGTVIFPVEIAQSGQIQIEVFNILGQRVAALNYNGIKNRNFIFWNLKNRAGNTLPAGMYVYRIQGPRLLKSGKLVILN
ncbi:MAG: S8 family peptidase [Calditrichia bacterium]